VLEAATRLSRLVEKLLDLSLLQAGNLEQRSDPYSLEDVLLEAVANVEGDGAGASSGLALDDDLPLLGRRGQLERAFANLLENAARYSAGKPVAVRAHAVGERVRVRIVDQGPGHPRRRARPHLPAVLPLAERRTHPSGLGTRTRDRARLRRARRRAHHGRVAARAGNHVHRRASARAGSAPARPRAAGAARARR
jgi:light-regulated signal transduction histidine kinase (bacteriophytochrome)